MSSMIVKPPDDEHAYEQIEAAVMETSRGRWFLTEYARRNRHAETVTILDAIDRLQRNIGSGGGRGQSIAYEHLHGDIIEMARAIARAEREIRQIRHDGAVATQYVSASDELDAVVDTTEQATSSILSAAEKIQEYAWTKREQGDNEADCDMLDACATDIYTACGFQDLTSQRIRKVVGAMRFLDERLKSILEATGLAEDFHADERMIDENGERIPVVRGSDIWMSDENQAAIDDTFDFFVPAAITEPTMVGADLMEMEFEAEEAAPAVRASPAAKADADAMAMPAPPAAAPEKLSANPYDGLSTEERMRAFR